MKPRLACVSKEVLERVTKLMDHNEQRRRDQAWTNLELLAKQVTESYGYSMIVRR
jgi:hypothetical protein